MQNEDDVKTAASIMEKMKVNVDLKIDKSDLVKYLVAEYLKPIQTKLEALRKDRAPLVKRCNDLNEQRNVRFKQIVADIVCAKQEAVAPLMCQLQAVITDAPVTQQTQTMQFVSVYSNEICSDGKTVAVCLNILFLNGRSYAQHVVHALPDAELAELSTQMGMARVELNKYDAEVQILSAQLDPYKRQELEEQLSNQLANQAFAGLQLPENWAQKLLPQLPPVEISDEDVLSGEDA